MEVAAKQAWSVVAGQAQFMHVQRGTCTVANAVGEAALTPDGIAEIGLHCT